MEYTAPATAFFAVRPGEVFHLSEVNNSHIAVMLWDTPALPGEMHPEASTLTVLCSGRYTTEEGALGDKPAWGWMHLEADTKEIIGRGLQSIGAEVGRWYYLSVSGGIAIRNDEAE